MSEVIALMGKVYTVPGNWAMVSQTEAILLGKRAFYFLKQVF